VEPYQIVIAVVGSAFAGAINTLAGNGSAITLTILTELIGLPGNLANGTNRVGIFSQTTSGAYAFYRHGRLDLARSAGAILFTSLGAVGGMVTALLVSNEQFMGVFRVFMVVMLFVILVKPGRWLRETDVDKRLNPWIAVPLFLAIGFYGGFIQMGMGVLFLAIMVLGARYSLTDANAVKLFVVGLYTALAVALFQWRGLIDWPVGLTMAVGQITGGYLTARVAAQHPKANLWAHRLLVVVVLLAIAKLFGLTEWVLGLF